MSGTFVPAAEAVREKLDWGTLAWCCRPSGMGLKNLVVIEVSFTPGGGHAFHKHPRQDEVIYCIDGRVEQWLEQEHRVLQPGDSIVIPAGTVHATFNTGGADAKLLAVLGPAIDDQNGYEMTEVAEEEPWKSLR